MIRPVLVVAALVAVLGLADAWLARRESRTRTEERRIGALFTPEEAERLRHQSALRLELSGESHAYGRVEGRWRCLSYHQAPADARAVQALLDGVAQAEGIVYTSASEEAPAYGINTPRTIRVSIQGPRALQDRGGDVLATLEIGSTQAGRAGCFVRKKGTREVWSIASDLRTPLEERLAPGLPPLLEASVVPSAWLEQGGVQRLTLERGAEHLRLERRDAALDPRTMQPGMLPWKWFLDPGADERELEDKTAEAYVGFVEHLPYVAVLDPQDRAEPGQAQVVVTLEGREGAPLRLELGARDAQGRVALWVETSATLYQVAGAHLDLVATSREALTRAYSEDDPWTAALRGADH